jgi:hypothetical protein
VLPLARTRDEHDRFVLAVLSQELSRIFVSQIGQIEEVFRVKGQRLSPAYGSDAIEAAEDVVELAIEQALEEKAALELVRSGTARQLMTRIGPMAAPLRW